MRRTERTALNAMYAQFRLAIIQEILKVNMISN